MKKNPHAVALGKLGAKARTEKTSQADRMKWARMGGMARAARHSKAELSKWARLGGRPKKEKGGKSNERLQAR